MKRIAIVPLLLLAGCANRATDLRPAMEAITAEGLLTHIKVLASDEYEGRAPGTEGERKTTNYLESQFREMGLKPGNPDGSYIQAVPLAGITSKTAAEFTAGGKKLAVAGQVDYVAGSMRYVPTVDVKDSEIVFVGYGVVAPEYGWDDYKGVDVKGKTILMLVNDPQVVDGGKLDDKMFKGKAMTYYGRWTYKYEIASEKGAAAAIIIHETAMAGYPFEVVSGSWGRENFDIQRPDGVAGNKDAGKIAVQGWMTFDKAAALCKLGGQDLAALKKAAVTKEFRPVALKGGKASFHVENTLRKTDSKNVIAKIEGTDANHNGEYVIYTAHWDHLGKDPGLQGDQIFNGARDNASGTAGLLEIANAYTKLGRGPKRSILFLSVTAEEKGLLGAKYYAENPLYPLKNTLADINMDELNTYGKTKDMTIVGLGNSSLDDVALEVLKAQGRTAVGDVQPEKGFYYRSDHFEFAKQGVPAFDPEGGIDYVGKPAGFGAKTREEFDEKDYHKVSDDVKSNWDLSGAVQDLQTFFEIGFRVSQNEKIPEWKTGTEFKAKRDRMVK